MQIRTDISALEEVGNGCRFVEPTIVAVSKEAPIRRRGTAPEYAAISDSPDEISCCVCAGWYEPKLKNNHISEFFKKSDNAYVDADTELTPTNDCVLGVGQKLGDSLLLDSKVVAEADLNHPCEALIVGPLNAIGDDDLGDGAERISH